MASVLPTDICWYYTANAANGTCTAGANSIYSFAATASPVIPEILGNLFANLTAADQTATPEDATLGVGQDYYRSVVIANMTTSGSTLTTPLLKCPKWVSTGGSLAVSLDTTISPLAIPVANAMTNRTCAGTTKPSGAVLPWVGVGTTLSIALPNLAPSTGVLLWLRLKGNPSSTLTGQQMVSFLVTGSTTI